MERGSKHTFTPDSSRDFSHNSSHNSSRDSSRGSKHAFTRKEKRQIQRFRAMGIHIFMALLLVGFIVGLMLFLRPAVSERENRKLTEFPKFTLSAFLDGSYFSEISLWYSDSYPMRDTLIALDHDLKDAYGVKIETRMVGGHEKGDEIPAIPGREDAVNEGLNTAESGSVSELDASRPTTAPSNSSQADASRPGTAKPGASQSEASRSDASQSGTPQSDSSQSGASQSDASSSDSSRSDAPHSDSSRSDASQSGASSNDSQPKKEVSIPDTEAMEASIQQHIQEGLYVKNGAAYSMYYFSQSAASTYIDALNSAARKLKGRANIYSILVPNNSGALLPGEELKSLGGSDQEQAIDYYYAMYDDGVTPVETFRTLREHNNEYLYFRTDHHWTQLAAWYVYRNFCEAKNIQPHQLSEFKRMTFAPFLGSAYQSLGDSDMAANPDSVTAYVPNGTNEMVYWDQEGVRHDWQVITDVSTWKENSKYACFIGGDRPLSIIENPEITDGSSCLVLKESYGNCFVPFLVDHYQTVYVVDFRYATENVVDYVKEHKIQDLILVNNISILSSGGVADAIAGLL